MSKTPEELAEAYVKDLASYENYFDLNIAEKIYKDAFTAGLERAAEETKNAVKAEWEEIHKWIPSLHFCPDWDFLLIQATDAEFEHCNCEYYKRHKRKVK